MQPIPSQHQIASALLSPLEALIARHSLPYSTMPDPAAIQDYRQTVEQDYCKLIVNLLNQNRQQFQIEQLLVQGLPQPRRRDLESNSNYVKLGSTAQVIEYEICHCLLYYLRKVQHIQNQGISLVGQAILEYERNRLGLSQATATAIQRAVSPTLPPPPPTDSAKLEEYDRHLFKALQRDWPQGPKLSNGLPDRAASPLKQANQAELGLLQRVLGIPDAEVPPAELLWSDRNISYIRLWRRLEAKQWREANRETLLCLIRAGGQPQRDLDNLNLDKLNEDQILALLDTIDASRIPLIDLQTLDLLWSQASSGRFGFKAQLKLWQEVNPAIDQKPDLEAFGKLVDWQRNNSWIGYSYTHFSQEAVRGHLPIFRPVGWWCWAKMEPLMLRVKKLVLVENPPKVTDVASTPS